MDAKAIIQENKAPETPPQVNEPDLTSKFVALTKREKAIQEMEKKLKDERTQFEPELNEYRSFKELREAAKVDSAAMSEAIKKALGMEFSEIAEIMAKDPLPPKDPEVMTLKQKIEQMEKASKEKEEQAKKSEEEEVRKHYKDKLLETAKADPQKYELVNIEGEKAIETALEVMEEYFNENNEMLSLDKSLEFVENYLLKETEKYKASQKLFPKSQDSQDKNLPSSKSISPTLTNRTVITDAGEDLSKLQPRERIQKIAAKYSTR